MQQPKMSPPQKKKRSQSEKTTYYMISTILHSGKDKRVETVEKSVTEEGQQGYTGGAQTMFQVVNISCVIPK